MPTYKNGNVSINSDGFSLTIVNAYYNDGNNYYNCLIPDILSILVLNFFPSFDKTFNVILKMIFYTFINL
jgi:hypothetical protein